MRRGPRGPRRIALVLLASLTVASASAGCGPGFEGAPFWETGIERAEAGLGSMRLLWTQSLTPDYEGSYTPVERAAATLDPPRDRIFVGSTAGRLYAMRANGGRVWGYDSRGAIESAPALDVTADEIYVGTEQGVLHALTASEGSLRWREESGGPLRQPPLLLDDAIYTVSDTDVVTAHARSNGEVLWSYRRDAPEGYSISGHAGLSLVDGKLMTAMTDGVVVALDPSDGTVIWERDTAIDVDGPAGGRPQFVDVDTTPVAVGADLYVASFAGGLYALDPDSGTVRWHDQTRDGVVGITLAGDKLLLSSADEGVVALSKDSREVLWSHRIRRGAASPVVVAGRTVLVSVSTGPFLALSLDNGEETSRFEAGYGFTAPPSVSHGVGFVIANSGDLHAFSY